MTINGAKGFDPRISDRFDLTLECIRRYDANEESPLSATIARSINFFALFGDFRSYMDFFLLDALVTHDFGVKFFMPFDDFRPPSVPTDVAVYKDYHRRSIVFRPASNHRSKQHHI